MDLVCPHCQSPVAVSDKTLAPGVLCASCGSTFNLDPVGNSAWELRDSGFRLGRFELLNVVGKGAFGTVYKARDPKLDRIVAVKVAHGTSLERDRFLREARSVAQLRHPCIVPIYEV